MEVKVTPVSDWSIVKKAACTTMWKIPTDKEPSSTWKKKILLARHSPIEGLLFLIELKEIPYYVSVHLVRHKIGITHWVSSQRDDRHDNVVPRKDMPQGALVNHTMLVNAQALIAISKKRLCGLASAETRQLWREVKRVIGEIDPEMAWAMQPECWWCGLRCPEMRGCGLYPPMMTEEN